MQSTAQSIMPTLVVNQLRRRRTGVEIIFPCELPTGGVNCRLKEAGLGHLHCRFSIAWWHLEQFGPATVSSSRALRQYARFHGMAFLVAEDLSVAGCFNRAGMTFVRNGGRLVAGLVTVGFDKQPIDASPTSQRLA